MPNLTGTTLGVYQVVERIGRGGMATVYKAYQPGVDRHVAIKVLTAELAANDTFARRFLREARILARLQHPHILPVFDFGQDGDVTYLVMPYLPSGTLADRLRDKPMPLPFIKRVARQMSEALDYAHSQGLLHRDIKPSNILLDEQDNCLLADFGIARLFEASTRLTATGGILGTPAYMSPEQGRGDALDSRSDVYSLGVILYQMATGRVPFTGDTPIGVVLQHVQNAPPAPRGLNPNLDSHVARVLQQALAKEPDQRFQTAGELARALEGRELPAQPGAVAGAQDETIVDALPAADASRGRRPNRRLYAVAALVFLVALLGGGTLIRSLTPDKPPATPPANGAGGDPVQVAAVITGTSPIATATASPTPTATATAVTPTATPTATAGATPMPSPSPTTDWRHGRLAFILSRSGSKTLTTQDLDTGSEPQVLFAPTSTFLLGPTWSPNGQQIALYEIGGQLFVVDAATGEEWLSPQNCTSPTWSPDGSQLLCRSSDPVVFRIFDVASGAVVSQVTRPGSAVLPEWSPTAPEIAYAMLDDGTSSIWRMSLENGLTQPLASGGPENYAPSWSPDGQWLAYQSRLGSVVSEIWIVDRNGQNARRLTATPSGAWSRAPSWSPDGQWLAYVSSQNGSIDGEHGEVFVIPVSGGDAQQVTFTGGSIYNWRADWGE